MPVLAGGSDLMVANSLGAGSDARVQGRRSHHHQSQGAQGHPRAAGRQRGDRRVHDLRRRFARSPIAPELLKDAASRMGAIALRNSATIGGNIGNASPKGDMPQPLILMDAEVVLTSVDGERRMLVDDYIISHQKDRAAARTRSSRRSSSPTRTSPTFSSARSVCAARTPSPS